MSRIQQILDKAEREGGIRRTVAPSLHPSQASASPVPVLPMDGHRTGSADGGRR
jgi:hypothetical protein